MTELGKLLAVLNLAVGMGVIITSTVVYANRPPLRYEEDVAANKDRYREGEKEAIAKQAGPWDAPLSFKQLNTRINGDTDTRGEAGVATDASREWGRAYAELKATETERARRKAELDRRLEFAKMGNPPPDPAKTDDPGGPGFYTEKFLPNGLLDLSALGDPVTRATDGKPIAGAQTLQDRINWRVKRMTETAQKLAQIRREERGLAKDVEILERRLYDQGVIRDSVFAELFYLESFEVNALEQRDTVLRRLAQLRARVAELNAPASDR